MISGSPGLLRLPLVALVALVALAALPACERGGDTGAGAPDGAATDVRADVVAVDAVAVPDAVADAAVDADGAADVDGADAPLVPDVPPDVSADVPPDVVADVPPDVLVDVAPDVVADVPPDVFADVPVDVPADVPVDVPPDVPADVPADVSSDIPGDVVDLPYPWLDDLEGTALRAALADLAAEGHVPRSYAGARDAIFGVGGAGLDVHGGRLTCIYTGASAAADGTTSPDGACAGPGGAPIADCEMNTEHSWPRGDLRTWLGDGTAAYDDAEADLHHLFPSIASANSSRGSWPFLALDCAVDPCDWELGGSARARGGSDLFWFHVRPETRGDIARAHVYMALRYGMPIDDPLEELTLRAWNREDPPDDEERRRNEAIVALQGNVNPFVLRPDLIDRLPDLGSGALADDCPYDGLVRWTEGAWCVDGCDGTGAIEVLYAGQNYQGTGVFLRGARLSGLFTWLDGVGQGGAPRVTLENELLVWELAEGRLDLDVRWDDERLQGRLVGHLTGARFRLLERLSAGADPADPADWAPRAPDAPWCLASFDFDVPID